MFDLFGHSHKRGTDCSRLRVYQTHCVSLVKAQIFVFSPNMPISEHIVYTLFGMVTSACLQPLRESCEQLHPTNERVKKLFSFSACCLSPMHTQALAFPLSRIPGGVSALDLLSVDPLVVTPSNDPIERSFQCSPSTAYSPMRCF